MGDRFSFIALDVETTGLHPSRGDRVVEVAAIRVVQGRLCDRFARMIGCDSPLRPEISAISGITRDMLLDQPPPSVVMRDLLSFIGTSVLVAHNSSFEQRFLRNEMKLLGYPFTNRFRCTLKLSRALLRNLPSYTLGSVARTLLGEAAVPSELHRAEIDALLTAKIYLTLLGITRKDN